MRVADTIRNPSQSRQSYAAPALACQSRRGFSFARYVMAVYSYKIGFTSKRGTKRHLPLTLSIRTTRDGVEIAKYTKSFPSLAVAAGFAWGGFAGCRLEGGTLTRPHSSTNTVLHFRFLQDGKWLSTDAIAPALKEASLRRSDRIRKERETLKRLDDAIKRGE